MVGCDDAGLEYKDILRRYLDTDAHIASVVDVGVGPDEHTACPHVAVTAARMVADGEADRALLICGTGLGVAIRCQQGARHPRRHRTRQLLRRAGDPQQ